MLMTKVTKTEVTVCTSDPCEPKAQAALNTQFFLLLDPSDVIERGHP